MASNQRRTDDLYRVKTRSLIYQNPDGSYPVDGSISYITDTSGTIGWSSALLSDNGSLTVPCGLSVSDNRFRVNCNTGYVDLYPNTNVSRNDSRINLRSSNAQLRLFSQRNPTTRYQEGVISVAALTGSRLLAPAMIFDASRNLIHITNTSNADIVVVDNSGIVSVNGNMSVNGSGTAPGYTQTDYITLPDQNYPSGTVTSRVWNEGNILLLQDDAGNTEPISGSNQILDPAGSVIPLLSAVATQTDIINTVNAILTRLSSRKAFFTTVAIPYPPITFQNPLRITFNWNGLSSGTITIGPYLTQNLDALVSAINTDLTGTPLRLNLNSRTQTVTLECIGGFTYTISDVATPGSAYVFMNHLGININTPITYVNRIFNVSINGVPIPIGGIGGTPTPPTTPPTLTVTGVTPTTISVSWGPYTGTNTSAFAIALGATTVAVVPLAQTSYTFTGLTTGVAYTINVYPLSLYDSGPVGSITKTIALNTLDITTTPSWTPTPYRGTPRTNVNLVVATVQTGIWSAQLAALTNVSQVASITLNYYSGYSQPGSYSGDARFMFGTTEKNPYIFYAYGDRIVPTKYGDRYAIGSPYGFGGTDVIAPTAAAAPFTITDPSYFTLIFSADVNGVINRTVPMKFNWYCGYSGTTIFNCEMTGFSVTYYA